MCPEAASGVDPGATESRWLRSGSAGDPGRLWTAGGLGAAKLGYHHEQGKVTPRAVVPFSLAPAPSGLRGPTRGHGSPPPRSLEDCLGVRCSGPRWCAEGARLGSGPPALPWRQLGPVPSLSFHQRTPGRVSSLFWAPRGGAGRLKFMELPRSPGCSPLLLGSCPTHTRLSSPSLLLAGCPLSAALTHRELFKAGLCDCLGHPRARPTRAGACAWFRNQQSLPPACRLLFLPTYLQGQKKGTGRAGAFETPSSIPVVMTWAD